MKTSDIKEFFNLFHSVEFKLTALQELQEKYSYNKILYEQIEIQKQKKILFIKATFAVIHLLNDDLLENILLYRYVHNFTIAETAAKLYYSCESIKRKTEKAFKILSENPQAAEMIMNINEI